MVMISFTAVVIHFVARDGSRGAERVLSLLCFLLSIGLLFLVTGYINNEAIGGYPSFIATMRPAHLYFGSWAAVTASLDLVLASRGIDRLWIWSLAANLVIVWSAGRLQSGCISDEIDDDIFTDDGSNIFTDDGSNSFTDDDPTVVADGFDDDAILDEPTTCHHVMASLVLGSIAGFISLGSVGLSRFNRMPLKVEVGVSILVLSLGIAQVGVCSFGEGPATDNYQVFDDSLTIYVANLFFSIWIALLVCIALWARQLQKVGLLHSSNGASIGRWSSWVVMTGFSAVVLAVHEASIHSQDSSSMYLGYHPDMAKWSIRVSSSWQHWLHFMVQHYYCSHVFCVTQVLMIVLITIGTTVAISQCSTGLAAIVVSHCAVAQRIDSVASVLCLSCWCALLPIIMNPDGSFAQARVIPFAPQFGGRTILNTNAYFLSWGAFLASLDVFLVCFEAHVSRFLPERGWVVLMVPNIILVSCASIFFRDGGTTCLTQHCEHGYWQYMFLLVTGLVGIVTSLSTVLLGKLRRAKCYEFCASAFASVLSSVGLVLVTFKEEDAVASQRLSYPGNVYFATVGCFGASLLVLTKHADLFFVGEDEMPESVSNENEVRASEDMQSTNGNDDGQVEAVSLDLSTAS